MTNSRIRETVCSLIAVLVQKTVVVVVLLVVFCGAAALFANRIPSSFLPDEDQGYAYVNVQLPNGASLERTTAVTADVEKILMNTPGGEHVTCFVGFSLLSFVRTSGACRYGRRPALGPFAGKSWARR